MTITSSTNAPLFVVVGSTGNQGRSVIDAIAADNKEYRVRGITRDTSKAPAQDLAKIGVEVVTADLNDAASVEKAFEGAEIVFGMTLSDYWTPNGDEQELKQGKLLADTAKKVGAKVFIWSGLPSFKELYGNNTVQSYENKAEVTKYARSVGGIRVIDVQPSSFASTYWQTQSPRPTSEPNAYILPLPYNADTKIPIIDIEADYGRYAVGALNHGVDTVYAASERITPVQMAEQYSAVAGREITFVPFPDDQAYEVLKPIGEKFATRLVAMFRAIRDVEYYTEDELSNSQKLLSYPARTFAEILKAHKAEVDKVFQ